MITRRSAVLSPFALMLLAREAAADTDLTFALDVSGPRPTVMVSIAGGAAEPWIFDSGASISVIKQDRATALGLANLGVESIGSPAGGDAIEAYRTSVTGARIGEAALPDFSAVAMPLPPQLAQTGVLSPNVFSGRLVRFEFARGQVRVTDRANAPAGEPTPYEGEEDALPGINVSVGGATHLAHMDSGAPHLIAFPYEMASSLPLTGAPVESGRARFVDGEHIRYSAQINGAVQIGPLTLTNPQITMIEGLPFVNVGAQALRQMTITLDPERHVSWAELA
jgi:hypothetical protein